jgi:hypothetical protein
MSEVTNDPQTGDPDELLDLDGASALLGVPVEQVRRMTDQGMITSARDDALRFRRSELIAVRQQGG